MGRRKKCTPPPPDSDSDRFWNLMTTPLYRVSDADLVWASQQDKLNSWMSKQVWLAEIQRRNSNNIKTDQCSILKQH